MNKKVEEEAPESIQQEPELTYEYRFVKLTNGDDILCQVPNLTMQDMFLVRYPVKVTTMFDPSADEAVYLFTPWVPFTSQDLISINKITIVTITTVRDVVRNLYERKIEALKQASMQPVPLPKQEEAPPEVDPFIETEAPVVDEDEEAPPPVKKPWVN